MRGITAAARLFILAGALALILQGCDFDKKQFLDVAKSTFESFYNNSGIADSTINWVALKINGDEVGRQYMEMSNDYERLAFRKGMVVRLRTICASKGWNPTNVKDWKIKERGVESAVVVGQAPGGTISMEMRKFGAMKKIGSIEIR
jgi:hypothetical protein